MILRRLVLPVCVLPLLFGHAVAQGLAPLPNDQQRITPLDQNANEDMLSTHPVAKRPVLVPPPSALVPPLSEQKLVPPPSATQPAPFGGSGAVAGKPNNYLPTKSPFGRATPTGPEVPSAPHNTVATPVGVVDSVEVSEPAPPTPPPVGADPVTEDPAAPTEFTSPIFETATDDGSPRKIVFRVLNKVTAQSSLFKARPGESAKFGRLEVIAEMCRVSAPNSPTDYAGLLDIREHLPGKEGGVKNLFHGWMYASSPSISGLEHPIYDVTMVTCELANAVPKEEAKTTKKPTNSKKK